MKNNIAKNCQAFWELLTPIYDDIFSNWFTMRVLIINTFKIIDIENNFVLFYDLDAWSNGILADCSAKGPRFKFCTAILFFQKGGVPAAKNAGVQQ